MYDREVNNFQQGLEDYIFWVFKIVFESHAGLILDPRSLAVVSDDDLHGRALRIFISQSLHGLVDF